MPEKGIFYCKSEKVSKNRVFISTNVSKNRAFLSINVSKNRVLLKNPYIYAIFVIYEKKVH